MLPTILNLGVVALTSSTCRPAGRRHTYVIFKTVTLKNAFSSNAVAALNLFRMANITGSPGLEQTGLQLEHAFSGAVVRSPADYPAMLLAADFELGPSFEVVTVGKPPAPDTESMLRALGAAFVPNKVVLLRPVSESSPEILRIAEYTRYETSIDGGATAYVCLKYNCKLPATDAGKMLESLGVKTPQGGRNSP